MLPITEDAFDEAPDSTPELSSCSSSTKEASSPSSRPSTPKSIDFNDIETFDDIAIDDSPSPIQPEPPAVTPASPTQSTTPPQSLLRPILRQAATAPPTPRQRLSSPNLRQIPSGLRATAALNNHQQALRDRGHQSCPPSSWHGPSPAPSSHGSSAWYPQYHPGKPSARHSFSHASATRARRRDRRPRDENTPTLPVRRPSLHPTRRKTVEELEKEYDDLDEDLPEDAIIWNVPLTPRPASMTVSELNMHAKQHSKTHERGYPERGTLAPPSGKRPTPFLGSGIGAHKTRAKSWTDAMSELSPEARKLTAKLESLSVQTTQEDSSASNDSTPTASPSIRSQRSSVSSVPSTTATTPAITPTQTGFPWRPSLFRSLSKSKSTSQIQTLELPLPATSNGSSPASTPCSPTKSRMKTFSLPIPPIQRGDANVQEMPVSAEKEKFLSRTRPSWLPPKSPKEERQHLKEWQAMMAGLVGKA